MVLQKIESDTYKNRYLSEDMRTNKEIWIDEYSKRMLSDEDHQNILQTALKIKRIHSSPIAHIHEVIEDNDITYIISDIPKGKKLHPLVNCNEKTLYLITLRLIQALLTLQRLDIKVHRLLPEQVYIDTNHEVQLLFERGMFLSSDQKSENGEIKSIGKILYFLILGEIPNDSNNVEEKLKAHCSDSLCNLVLRMLSDEDSQKFLRLEQIIPLVEEKRAINTDSIVLSCNIDVPVSHKIYRSLIIIFAVVFLYSVMYHPKSFALEKISTFDKVRFHVLGHLGISEAQQVLGEIYEKGYGVKQNYQESIQWYKKAAQSGNVYAQMSLGHFYDQGIGVAIDKKQAMYWFTLAAANGDELAKERVEILTEYKAKKVDNHIEMRPIELDEKTSEVVISDVIQESKKNSVPIINNDAIITKDIVQKNEPLNIKTESVKNEKKIFRNGIMWQDNEDTVTLKLTWNEAMSYCLNLKLDGYDDWRLPNKEILFQLFFEQQDLQYHSDDLYWTSTQDTDLTAWRVYFNYNGGANRLSLTSNSKNDRWNVRCYRKIK